MSALRLALALPCLLVAFPLAAQDGRAAGLIFDRLDADGNGEISASEMEQAKARRFDRADADGNGSLTEAELQTMGERLARIASLAGEAMLEGARRLDDDRDGTLSRTEFTAISPFFTLIDADGNGAVSRAEFDRARAAFSRQP